MGGRKWTAVLCLALCAACASAGAQSVLNNGRREYVLDACHRDAVRRFYILAGAETFYVWSNIGASGGPELYLQVTTPGLPIVLGRYVKLGGETVEVRFDSSDPSIVFPMKSGRFTARSPGRVVLSVTIADARVDIPVRIVPLPIWAHAKVDDIIAALGLPDRLTKELIPWPESRIVDNVLYPRRDEAKGWRVHHWMYDAYPGLVIALDDSDTWPIALYNETWEMVRREWLAQNY